MADPARAVVSLFGAFTVTLVPALLAVPAVTGASPAAGSVVLTALLAPVLYVVFGRAEPNTID